MSAYGGVLPRRGLTGLLAATLMVGLLAALPGPTAAAADGADPFVAKIEVGPRGAGGARCSGALVSRQWLITAKACFQSGPEPLRLGPPPRAATADVGTAGAAPGRHVSPIVRLIPHPERDVVLARLATTPADAAQVDLAASAPAPGDVLRLAGFGRTATEWVPDQGHSASFEVTAVHPTTVEVAGAGADTVGPCKGDAGGPALRDRAGDAGPELVAIGHTSWQAGCLGESGTRRGATETRVDDIRDWIRQMVADVGVFGVTADRRLTYSGIESASGIRVATTTSSAALPFAPKAFAVLNHNTVLLTSPEARLYRLDVESLDPLVFAPPVEIGQGWSHEHLSYDGDGSLYGLAAGSLRRYTITSAKPTGAHIVRYTVLQPSGFGTVSTFTTTGPDWVLGTTSGTEGELLAYRITRNARPWDRYELASSGWTPTHLFSPGGGHYYARTPAGALLRYRDPDPFDGTGADLQTLPPVDASGWNQTRLSAVPFGSYPEHAADVSVFGVTSDGRLTHSLVDSTSGTRVRTTTSAAALGFPAKAMATLNFNTVLVTSTAGDLYRVDVVATDPLVFAPPVDIGNGWSHDLLTYDGAGALFGTAAGRLLKYPVTSAKPSRIDPGTQIGTGFGSLVTIAASGPMWLVAVRSDGALLSYRINTAAPLWNRFDLATGWNFTHLLSPGEGHYYARAADGRMTPYRDADPFDGSGADVRGPREPVESAGWTERLLSAQPFIA